MSNQNTMNSNKMSPEPKIVEKDEYIHECDEESDDDVNEDESNDKYMVIKAITFYETFYKIDKTKYSKNLRDFSYRGDQLYYKAEKVDTEGENEENGTELLEELSWVVYEDCVVFEQESDEESDEDEEKLLEPTEWFEQQEFGECSSWNGVLDDAESYYGIELNTESSDKEMNVHDELYKMWKKIKHDEDEPKIVEKGDEESEDDMNEDESNDKYMVINAITFNETFWSIDKTKYSKNLRDFSYRGYQLYYKDEEVDDEDESEEIGTDKLKELSWVDYEDCLVFEQGSDEESDEESDKDEPKIVEKEEEESDDDEEEVFWFADGGTLTIEKITRKKAETHDEWGTFSELIDNR